MEGSGWLAACLSSVVLQRHGSSRGRQVVVQKLFSMGGVGLLLVLFGSAVVGGVVAFSWCLCCLVLGAGLGSILFDGVLLFSLFSGVTVGL